MLGPIYLMAICLSAITFMVLNHKLVKFLRPKTIDQNQYLDWKWRNILTSFCHSFTVGFGVLYVLVFDREISWDLISVHSSAVNAFICISIGYFVYDLILSLTNLRYPGRVEIIVHHMITLLCLIVSLSQQRFLAYCVVGLTVEISSVFIHIRELSILSGISNLSKVYSINTVFTILTLVLFRFLPLSWITIGLYANKHHIEWPLLLMGVIFLAIIFLVSSVLLIRVIAIDYKFNISQMSKMQLIVINLNNIHYKCSSKLKKFFSVLK